VRGKAFRVWGLGRYLDHEANDASEAEGLDKLRNTVIVENVASRCANAYQKVKVFPHIIDQCAWSESQDDTEDFEPELDEEDEVLHIDKLRKLRRSIGVIGEHETDIDKDTGA